MLATTTDLLNRSNLLSLASINDQGYPRVCIVTKLHNDGLDKIYIATGTSSNKTKHFQANPKASICYYDEQASAILIGHINIVECPELKQALWQDWLLEHLPGGVNDPEYCVLEFVPTEGSICVAGKIEPINLK